MKVLIAIDVQNDFIDGSLYVDKDKTMTNNIGKYMYICKCEHVPILATRDTHADKDIYLKTLEGRNLPISHCVKHSEGWNLDEDVAKLVPESNIVDKNTFGSIASLPEKLSIVNANLMTVYGEGVTEIEICGFCTDICVISNAIILRAAFPDWKITILKDLCCGSSPERHAAALNVALSNMIDVRNSSL